MNQTVIFTVFPARGSWRVRQSDRVPMLGELRTQAKAIRYAAAFAALEAHAVLRVVDEQAQSQSSWEFEFSAGQHACHPAPGKGR